MTLEIPISHHWFRFRADRVLRRLRAARPENTYVVRQGLARGGWDVSQVVDPDSRVDSLVVQRAMTAGDGHHLARY